MFPGKDARAVSPSQGSVLYSSPPPTHSVMEDNDKDPTWRNGCKSTSYVDMMRKRGQRIHTRSRHRLTPTEQYQSPQPWPLPVMGRGEMLRGSGWGPSPRSPRRDYRNFTTTPSPRRDYMNFTNQSPRDYLNLSNSSYSTINSSFNESNNDEGEDSHEVLGSAMTDGKERKGVREWDLAAEFFPQHFDVGRTEQYENIPHEEEHKVAVPNLFSASFKRHCMTVDEDLDMDTMDRTELDREISSIVDEQRKCSLLYPFSQLRISGNVRNISLALFDMTHLTHLYINDNTVTKLPAEIGRLHNLVLLDASNNKLRALPQEIGDLTKLKELYLANNYIRFIPLEMGRLFNVQILSLKGNPLPQELLALQAEVNGTQKLLTLLLDALPFPSAVSTPIQPLHPLTSLSPPPAATTEQIISQQQLNHHQQQSQQLILQHLQAQQAHAQQHPHGQTRDLTTPLHHGLPHPGSPQNMGQPNNLTPPPRSWLPLSTPTRSRPSLIFTVLCYNVLCDKYATRQMYGYCPTWALDWAYRRKLILQELKHYAADIISLQEVETDQFYNYFLPELQCDGYAGIFAAKSRAKTMAESDRKFVDGCAIFYRTNKFKLIKEHLVEFNQLAMANAEGSDDMLNRVMTKDNIGLAALLETRVEAWDNGVPQEYTPPLLVCTAHIHWDPEFCDVKLVQTMMLMHELRQIADEFNPPGIHGKNIAPNDKVHLLLCGDFNSLPESGVIEFLSASRISAKHPDFKDLGYKTCLSRISYNNSTPGASEAYPHAFKLNSAYNSEVMPYTNYTFDFKGIIDYIFFSKPNMTPLGLLGPLDNNWLTQNKIVGAPHPVIPSDHFPLLVELEMTSGSNQPHQRR